MTKPSGPLSAQGLEPARRDWAAAGQDLLSCVCRKAQGWLEQMRQLKETEDQVSAAKRNILQAVTLALEEHGVQEEKREVKVPGVDRRPCYLFGLPPAASS